MCVNECLYLPAFVFVCVCSRVIVSAVFCASPRIVANCSRVCVSLCLVFVEQGLLCISVVCMLFVM